MTPGGTLTHRSPTKALQRFTTPRKRARYAAKAAQEQRRWHRDRLGRARRETHPAVAP